MWHFRTWFSGGHDLKDLFQVKLFYDSVATSEAKVLQNIQSYQTGASAGHDPIKRLQSTAIQC